VISGVCFGERRRRAGEFEVFPQITSVGYHGRCNLPNNITSSKQVWSILDSLQYLCANTIAYQRDQ